MMILRSVPPSPVRAARCILAASVLGLTDQIKLETADPNDAADSLRQQNPLGKIPALVTRGRLDAVRLARDRGISRPPRRRRQDHPARAQGALCRAPPAGAGRRHDRRANPAGLRRPLPPAGASRQEMDRLSGRQDQARPDGARGRSAVARSRSRTSARSRSPAFSATAICASPATGGRRIRKLVVWLDRFAAKVPAFAETKVAA